MKYKTIRSLVRFVMNIIADVEVVGMDKLPQGNVILAANHLGRLDTAVLIYALEREDLIMAVAEKYKDHPIFGAIGRSVNAIWLNRFEADFAALREILARMQKGGLMVIAPEGTRSKTESLQEGKMGAAFLAGKSGYPVLPIALTGTEDRGIISNLKRFRRSKIKAVAGELFYIEIPKGQGREEAMRNATDEIMCQIAAKLPESYRGFYKDYPRVRELEQK
ncbi:lysophospholipid acyltransferase family protein [Candidatus Villigracilis saccharophilus]|uniref:lysophospholipid acyltransferase family protein n=1 Tax=Candidatus Villigracilis saccharophilus TaxID=3140684 RepID=UPI003135B3BB|nr:1-acyl-sn-glycerol-3-phosphate acyltransferase [Anaerolineales bacterium]